MRTVQRQATRRGFRVCTVHPGYGELFRGTVEWRPGRASTGPSLAWEVTDTDHRTELLIGDYLDAEARLMELTPWADAPDED